MTSATRSEADVPGRPAESSTGAAAHIDGRDPLPANAHGTRPTPLRERLPLLVLLAGLAAEGAYTGVLVDRGFFFADDFVNFDNVAKAGLTFNSLAASIFGHFIPWFNLENLILDHVASYNYPTIIGIDVAMYLLTGLVFFRLLTHVAASRPWVNVVVTLLLGMSLITVPGTLWWANAASNFPAICFSLLTVDCGWRYFEDHRKSHLLTATLSFVVALGFFESSLIAVLALAFVFVLFAYDRQRDGAFVRAARKTWPLWVCLLVPAIVDLGYRFSHKAVYTLPARPGLHDLAHFFRTAWGLGFGPGLVGVDFPYRAILASTVLTVLAGQVAILGTAAYTMVRYRRAWRGWCFFGVTFFLYLLATGYARAGLKGTDTGLVYDYLFFGPYLFYLSFALATRDGLRRPAVQDAPAGSGWAALGSFAGGLLIALALAASVGGSVFSAVSIANETDGGWSQTLFENPASPRSSRLFFDTALASLTAMRSTDPQAVVYDSYVANAATGNFFAQFRPDSEFVSDVVRWAKFDRYAPTGYVLDQGGFLQPAYWQALATAIFDRSSAQGGATVRPNRGGGICVTGTTGGQVIIPFTSSKAVAPLPEPQIRFTYTAKAPVTIVPDFLVQSTEVPALRYQPDMPLLAGHHTVLLGVINFYFANLVLQVPAGASFCVQGFDAGQPQIGALPVPKAISAPPK